VSIGEALAAARTEAGLSVEDVSAATRMRGTVIRAIERDDFRLCGGDFYARGHIRNIAHVVGVDPEPLIRQFDSAYANEEDGAAPASKVFEAETSTTKPERRGPNWTAAMAAVLVALVAFGVFQVVHNSGSGRQAAHHTPPPTPSPTVTTQPTSQPTPPPSTTTPSAPPSGAVAMNGVTVVLKVSDLCWVTARASDGTDLFSANMQPGTEKIFTDPQKITLVLGNSGGVNLTVNGRDLGTPGAMGQVTRFTFHPGDPLQSQG
jgi:cytoskeletal protein RodZ